MLKKLLFSSLLLCLTSIVYAQAPSIIKSGGWLETAFIEWQTVSGASSYNVYYTGGGKTNQKIDNSLIRGYGSYFRADIPGLKAGAYTLKVAAVISGSEKAGTTSGSINVLAQDRSGFAFSNNRVPGAYKSDGTPKDGAVILYISENNKNTISLDVTGASSNPCVGLQTILDGFKKGNDTRPLIIRLIGQVKDMSYMLGGDIVIENSNNANSYITFEGVGEDATADGWGIRIKNASNIEVRNIGTINCNSSEGDNIGLQQNDDYIWIHNCDFFYGDAGGDADQVKGDGALDCKKSTYVTFSYNHFWDSGKCNLLGLSEGTTEGLYITYHHNWYDHSDSRHPRVRYYSAHVYNNYYDGNAKYGIGSTLGSSVFAEGNYFRNCKYPMLTSMQGSDVFDESSNKNDYSTFPTFSKEDGGSIKALNNYMIGQKRFVAYGNSSYPKPNVDFDAYVITAKGQSMPSSVTSAYGANKYNNFELNTSIMYNYTAETPTIAKDKTTQLAGRMNGGDLQFTFNNAVDDESYAVNTALKAKLTSYKTKLVSIQGGGTTPTDGGDGGNGNTNPVAGDEIHNFTLSGISSSFYSITGSLSSSKGSVNYNNLTLTQALKIESGTNISFTTSAIGAITLIFNDDFSGNVKIDGTSYPVSMGKITKSLSAGNHTITKDDSTNLFYMSYKANAITGLNDFKDSHLTLYPNPAFTELYISSKEAIETIEVFSLLGELEKTIMGPNIESIDIHELKTGTHILKITGINYSEIRSFVKE